MIGGTMSEKRACGSRKTWMNSLTTNCQMRANIRSSIQRLLKRAKSQHADHHGKNRHLQHWTGHRRGSGALQKDAFKYRHIVAGGKNPGDDAHCRRHLIDRKGEAGEQEGGQKG